MFLNSSTSSSDSARDARIMRCLQGFVCGFLLLLLPGVLLAYFMGPISGDLVRVGKLGERYFGARHPQGSLERQPNPPRSVPDVLVLGDSFSVDNFWQSRLTEQTGLHTGTYHYDDVPCIDRWIRDALGGRLVSGVKIIVVSSVERNFFDRFGGDMPQCDTPATVMRARPVEAKSFPPPGSPFDLFPMNIAHQLKTALHQYQVMSHRGRMQFDRAVVVDLTRKDLFSHQEADRLLYYLDDDKQRKRVTPEMVERAVANLELYQQLGMQAGVKLVFSVVPNKSSVYAPWVVEGQMPAVTTETLYARLVELFGPSADLLTLFRQQAQEMKDFYAPNDSHLSLTGFRVLGDQIALALQPPAQQ